MERIRYSIPDIDAELFEVGREKMGMTRSAYIHYLIYEHENKLPVSLKYKELIDSFSNFSNDMKHLELSNLDDNEKIKIFETLDEIKKQIKIVLTK